MIVNALQNIKHFFQTSLAFAVDSAATGRAVTAEKTLLVVHLDAIGDYVLFRNFLPMIRNHRRFRDYRITLCGNVAYRELAEQLDARFVDEFIWIDRNSLRYDIGYRFRMMRELSRRGFEVAVQSAYSRIYYWGDSIIKASGARERIGSGGDATNMKTWQKKIADAFYTSLLTTEDEVVFEFRRNTDFFRQFLGECPVPAKPVLEVEGRPPGAVGSGRYAVIFPGAGVGFREWSTDKYAQIADYLATRYGLRVVVAGGGRERTLAERIVAKSRTSGSIVDMTGRTTLPELAGIVAASALLVSNETSAVHIAVAVGTSVVCISNGNQFGRFSPYPQEIFDRAYYLFPPYIAKRMNEAKALSNEFRVRSRLDIDDVGVDEVRGAIDKAMSVR